jgi:hypothetical protein
VARQAFDVDRRALSPLLWSNANVNGHLPLDVDRHLDLDLAPAGLPGGPPLTIEPAVE